MKLLEKTILNAMQKPSMAQIKSIIRLAYCQDDANQLLEQLPELFLRYDDISRAQRLALLKDILQKITIGGSAEAILQYTYDKVRSANSIALCERGQYGRAYRSQFDSKDIEALRYSSATAYKIWRNSQHFRML